MNNFIKTLIAGYGAKKLGGGCFSTVLIFIVIFYALGYCGNNRSRAAQISSPKTNVIKIKNVSPVVRLTL